MCIPWLPSIQHKVECTLLYLWFVEELQGSLIPFQQICLALVQASTVATAPYEKANHCQCVVVMEDNTNTQVEFSSAVLVLKGFTATQQSCQLSHGADLLRPGGCCNADNRKRPHCCIVKHLRAS